MEVVVWQWGPFSIAVFSLTFFSAVVISLVMFFVESRRKYLPEQRVVDFFILALVSGICGSRLVYALLFNLQYYLENPIHLFRLQDGGMSFWGGLIPAFIVVSIWAARKQVIVERYLDAAAPALVFGLALGNVGLAPQGKPMPALLPWGIAVGDTYHHPDGAYAVILLVALLFMIWWRRPRVAYEGELFIWFLLGYGLINLGLDFTRLNTAVLGIFSAGQVVSLAVVLFAFYFSLAGPKMLTSSPYLGRKIYAKKSKSAALFRTVLFLLLSGGMVALYYLTHRLPTL